MTAFQGILCDCTSLYSGAQVEHHCNYDFLVGFLAVFAADPPTQGEMMVLLA